jgi:ketosteroid isomerase-like protein
MSIININPPATELDKNNLDAARNELLEGMAANDIDRFMAVLTDDHVTYPPGVAALENKKDFLAWQEKRIESQKNLDIDFDLQFIKTEIYDGIAYDRSLMKMSVKSKVGGESTEVKSQVIWIWKKISGGQWRIAEAIWNDF